MQKRTELTLPPMTKAEIAEFERRRKNIARSKELVWEWIEDIRVIRDQRLYREAYKTFDAFVDAECGLGRSYINRLISAGVVKENLVTIVTKNARVEEIATEGQLRELTDVPDELLKPVIKKAVEIAGDSLLSAKVLRQAVAEVVEAETTEDREPGSDDETPEETELYAKPKAEQALESAKIHRAIHAKICEAIAMLKEVPNQPGTELLLSRQSIIMRDLDNAKNGLNATRPHAVCPRCKGDGCPQCGNLGWVNSALNKELTT